MSQPERLLPFWASAHDTGMKQFLGRFAWPVLHLRMATEVTEERRSADLIGTTRYQMRGPMYTMNQIGSHESTRKYQ